MVWAALVLPSIIMSRPGTPMDGRPITPSTTEDGDSRPNTAGSGKHGRQNQNRHKRSQSTTGIVFRADAEPRELTEDEREELREAFKLFDHDGDGTMNKDELGTVMRSLGQEITHENLDLIFESVDRDNSGTICFDEFILLMSRFMPPEGNTEDELKAAFAFFDKGNQGSFGYEEIEQAIHQLGFDITPVQMKNMLACADADHDGKLDFDDLKRMWIVDEDEKHKFMGGDAGSSPSKRSMKPPDIETIH